MSSVEIIAALFGLACVVLYVRESSWSWPTGLVQVTLFVWVFSQARLYSDVLTTSIWSEILFGETPENVQELAELRTYVLYLVMNVDVPWVDDAQRFFGEPDVRRSMFERFVGALQARGRPYRVISGSWASESAPHASPWND